MYLCISKTCHFFFYDNFGKYGSIWIILPLLHSQKNCGRSHNKISHLSPDLLPQYLGKSECLTVQFYCEDTQFRTISLPLISMREIKLSSSMCSIYLPSTSTHARIVRDQNCNSGYSLAIYRANYSALMIGRTLIHFKPCMQRANRRKQA